MSQYVLKRAFARIRLHAVAMAACLVLVLTGCAQAPATQYLGTAPEPSPTAACPDVDGQRNDPGCAYYDPTAAMAINELYRERRSISAENEAVGNAMISKLTAALEHFVGSDVAFTPEDVKDAIVSIGLERDAIRLLDGRANNGVAFGIEIGGGCVFGGVSDAGLEVEVGGWTMDSSCLVMDTH